MKQNLTFKGRKKDGTVIEQTIPGIEVPTPGHLPAAAAELIQKFLMVTGMVNKDPKNPDKIVGIPAHEIDEFWCDIPSILVVDALEGEQLIRP